MTETIVPQYTERQKALIRREVEPANLEEENYIEKHDMDDLGPETKDRKPMFSITGDDLERSRIYDRGSTHAAHQSEGMDERDDKED